jgi:hypothetical protein
VRIEMQRHVKLTLVSGKTKGALFRTRPLPERVACRLAFSL